MVSLVLASQSMARQKMLHNVGLDFTAVPANLDEASILHKMVRDNKSPRDIALALAKEKALYVAKKNPDALVIGGDQILELDGKILSKAKSKDEALDKLKAMRAKTHALISGVCVARGDKILWSAADKALLKMFDLDDEALARYADRAGEALTRSVGAYELESHGAWLFEEVRGSFFTVLGMPLLPLLAYLRAEQGVQP